jgi:hypothetical protein
MLVSTRPFAAALAGLALTSVLGSCATDPGDPAPVADGSPRAAESSKSPASAPATHSAAPSPARTITPAPTPTPTTAPTPVPVRVGLAGRLLTAAEMPRPTQGLTWRNGATQRGEGGGPFGTCAWFPMSSIGATRVVTRDYHPADASSTATGGSLVAQFADEMTARRAYEVLRSWRAKCTDQLAGYARHDVSQLRSVPGLTGGAVGDWYFLSYGPVPDHPGHGYLDVQGLTRKGNRIAVLETRQVAPDGADPADTDPMVDGVRAAAAKL